MTLLEFLYWSDWMLGMQVFLVLSMVVLAALIIKLVRLLRKLIRPPTEGKDEMYFSKLSIYEGKFLIFSITGKLNIMSVTLTNTQEVSGVLTFQDKKLEITDVPDGAVTLAVADETIATASYEDATNKVSIVAHKKGVTALSITATNKAGQNIPFDDIAVEVTSGDAKTGGVAFGEPTEQPE